MTLAIDTRVLILRTPDSYTTDTLEAVVTRARQMPVSGRWIYTVRIGRERWRVLTQDMLNQVVKVLDAPLAAAA